MPNNQPPEMFIMTCPLWRNSQRRIHFQTVVSLDLFIAYTLNRTKHMVYQTKLMKKRLKQNGSTSLYMIVYNVYIGSSWIHSQYILVCSLHIKTNTYGQWIRNTVWLYTLVVWRECQYRRLYDKNPVVLFRRKYEGNEFDISHLLHHEHKHILETANI